MEKFFVEEYKEREKEAEEESQPAITQEEPPKDEGITLLNDYINKQRFLDLNGLAFQLLSEKPALCCYVYKKENNK